MPHNWAFAEFIRLVRHLLVFERGDTLDLLPAVPPHWLEPGCTLHVDMTPTRFGWITLELRADEDELEVRVLREGGVSQPVSANLHLSGDLVQLTLPQGEEIVVKSARSVRWRAPPNP